MRSPEPDHTAGSPSARRVSVATWFAITAALGTLHAAFSVYWGVGGHWLEETLGHRIVEQFARARWVLILVGAVKAGAAWAPFLALRGARFTRAVRVLSWGGAVILVAWGGTGMVAANLSLAGIVGDGQPTDRAGLIGHAWLWDPLFVLWGSALLLGLWCQARTTPVPPDDSCAGGGTGPKLT